ncbi:unnamed protein product [Lupinus luteus]|uniref:Uncharacterized protein n=1 Tax=Lupinus luteus TaxID=3873 RepID=A0AAV1WL95_LUPLU
MKPLPQFHYDCYIVITPPSTHHAASIATTTVDSPTIEALLIIGRNHYGPSIEFAVARVTEAK